MIVKILAVTLLALVANSVPAKESRICSFCEFLGEEVQSKLTNETVEDIIDAGVAMCHSELPAFLAKKCEIAIKEYGIPYIYEFLKDLDVKEVCVDMGLCSEDARHMLEASELFQVISRGLRESDGCKACKDGIRELKMILSAPETLDLLHVAVKEACGLAHVPFCETMANAAIGEVLQEIIKLLDADKVCSGLCAEKKSFLALIPASKVENSVSGNNLGDLKANTCIICTLVADKLLTALKNEDLENMAKEGVEKICSIVPIPGCTSMADSYVDMLFGILKTLDGNSLCSLIGMCNSGQTVAVPVESVLCPGCKTVVSIILKYLLIPINWDIAEFDIQQVCIYLPIPNCKSSIHEIISKIHDFIKQQSAASICSEIGLCNKMSEFNEMLQVNKFKDVCSECAWAANEIVSLVTNPEVDGVVKSLAETFCAVVPIQGCEDIADSFIDMVIDEIKKLDGKTMCDYVGLC